MIESVCLENIPILQAWPARILDISHENNMLLHNKDENLNCFAFAVNRPFVFQV